MSVVPYAGDRSPDRTSSRLYRAVWRWHFYAGLFVVPFFVVLALTGMLMLYGNSVQTMLGPNHPVATPTAPVALTDQAAAAQAAVPGGAVKMFVQAAQPSLANKFVVSGGEGGAQVVAVDPNDAAVIATYAQDGTLFNWASNIHGTLLLGSFGDRLLEVAAGLGIVLLLTGIYMWWPRGDRGLAAALIPRFGSGRALWRDLHRSVGFYLSVFLLFFLLTGLSWTGIWGERIVQAWNTLPAQKFDAPLSDLTHGDLNTGHAQDAPWALDQTPLPASGHVHGEPAEASGGHDHAGAGHADHAMAGHGTSTAGVDLDDVAALAREMGFTGQFRINLPMDQTGVFTISSDSTSGDNTNPFGDRTVHVDRYSGRVISEVGFADYSLGGKAMAAGTALHQGNLGWWNIALNLTICAGVILISVSGVVMWWKRRPKGRVAAPRYPRQYRAPWVVIAIAAAVSLAFPLTGVAIILFALIDVILPRRVKEAGHA